MKKARIDRHSRHILLKEIGGHGQNLIANTHVAIIGAGGLGSPVLLYLAAAGIGKITIIDNDIIELSNLQRQVIFKTNDIGEPKAETAKNTLNALDDEIEIIAINERINAENAFEILKDADIIIDGCDNFETRFIVNRAAFDLNKILISGAIGRFDGQVAAFDYREGKGPCYNCLVPQIPPNSETCSEMGVIGALAGVVGTLMAIETLKIITSAGDSLLGQIMLFDGLKTSMRKVKLAIDKDCKTCQKHS